MFWRLQQDNPKRVSPYIASECLVICSIQRQQTCGRARARNALTKKQTVLYSVGRIKLNCLGHLRYMKLLPYSTALLALTAEVAFDISHNTHEVSVHTLSNCVALRLN
jgi:hypothetical protein